MLNREWQKQVFAQALSAVANGTYIFVGPQYPEIEDLVARGFLKLDKRKKDAEGNVSAVAVDGITQDHVDAVLSTADAAPAPAPVATETLAPTPAPAPAPAPAPIAEQPVFDGEPAATVSDVVLGSTEHSVIDTVALGGENFEIETGVQFVKRAPNIAALARSTVREDKYPFAAIADLKLKPEHINDDTFLPSFHIANKQLKNMSGMLKRFIEKYEATTDVTFRAQQVKANDPKGEGVRVFAMNKHTAPARKSPAKKKGADLAASPVATPVDGTEGVQQA